MYETEQAVSSFSDFLEELYGVVFYSYSTVVIIIAVISAIIALIVAAAIYVTEAYATYTLSKKLGRSMCYLAWVPVLGKYFRTFVICDMTDKPFQVLDKYTVKNRRLSFLLYVGILVFGNTLITAFIGVVNVLPGLGQVISAVSTLLYLVPVIVTTYMEFVYLKDAMDLFRVDRKSNQTFALIASIADQLATQGIARIVCLYMLLKKAPLPKEHVEIVVE